MAFDPWVDAVSGSDTNDGSFATPVKTIKKALTLVTASGTIHVRPGTYNTGLGETFPITVPSGITLQSTTGASATIVDATGANTRVLYCSANTNSTVVEGFTIKGGLYTQPADGNSGAGGGIFMDNNDQTTIRRCIITGNEVRGYNGNNTFFSGAALTAAESESTTAYIRSSTASSAATSHVAGTVSPPPPSATPAAMGTAAGSGTAPARRP